MDRRQFLKSSAHFAGVGLASQLGLLSLSAMANPGSQGLKDFFVLILVPGGMDVTLGLDPRIHAKGQDQDDIFLEYRPDQIFRSGNIQLGPAAVSLQAYAKEIVILNGINMRRDAGHEVNLDYMASGSGAGNALYLPVNLGFALSSIGALGVLDNGRAAKLGGKSIPTTALRSFLDSEANHHGKADLFQPNPEFTLAEEGQSLSLAFQNFFQTKNPRSLVYQNLVERFNMAIPNAAVMFEIFKAGLASHAVYTVENIILDSHSNHTTKQDGIPGNHWINQEKVWSQVADIFAIAKATPYSDGSLFDRTNFMVVSEFSRTPSLNSSNGKDHNPFTNSILLAGPKFRGGQTIGKSLVYPRNMGSDSIHIGAAFDFKTGQPVAVDESPENLALSDVRILDPESIVRSIAHAFGDPKDAVGIDYSLPVIPGLLKG